MCKVQSENPATNNRDFNVPICTGHIHAAILSRVFLFLISTAVFSNVDKNIEWMVRIPTARFLRDRVLAILFITTTRKCLNAYTTALEQKKCSSKYWIIENGVFISTFRSSEFDLRVHF